jgi:HEAT repeat protein
LPFLEDPDPGVRAGAVLALRRLGDPVALDAVKRARGKDRRTWRYWVLARGNYRKTIKALRKAQRAAAHA